MGPLQRDLIRLAYQKPEFRELLLPLVKRASWRVYAQLEPWGLIVWSPFTGYGRPHTMIRNMQLLEKMLTKVQFQLRDQLTEGGFELDTAVADIAVAPSQRSSELIMNFILRPKRGNKFFDTARLQDLAREIDEWKAAPFGT